MPAILNLYKRFLKAARSLQSVLLLVIRLWMAHVFWVSGLVKIDDFSNTIALFRDEYQVPVISPVFAAYSGTFFELTCPILLTFGLCTRLSTLPLLAMTAVIQFTYDQNIQHAYWAMLLTTILVFGGGKLSADYFAEKKFINNES